MNGLVALGVVAAFLVGMLLFYSSFSSDCKAHGGAHTTFPYKSWPECWSEDGRRVFW